METELMNGIFEVFLVTALLAVCVYSMWLSHESTIAMQQMMQQIQMMFVKS
jgi:hypothetical protein